MAALQSSELTTFNADRSTLNCLILLVPCRINDIERHGEKKIANQNRKRGVNHRLGRRPADANSALACGQSFVATDEDNENAEAERFRQAHNDVAIARPLDHVRHVVWAVDSKKENRNEITSGNSD